MKTEIFKIISSTNDYLKEKSKNSVLNPKDGVIAFSQTKGRGRLGRSFESPEGGIYISFCYDNIKVPNDSYLSIMPSVAATVSRFIKEKLELDTGIKWPNDVLFKGRKCSGILAERTQSGDLIIGVGLNFTVKEFDESLKNIAISLFTDVSETLNKEDVAKSLLDSLRTVKSFEEDTKMFDYYNEHLLYKGKIVTLKTIYGNEIVEGECLGVDKYGAILLKNESGTVKAYNTGELTTHINNK